MEYDNLAYQIINPDEPSKTDKFANAESKVYHEMNSKRGGYVESGIVAPSSGGYLQPQAVMKGFDTPKTGGIGAIPFLIASLAPTLIGMAAQGISSLAARHQQRKLDKELAKQAAASAQAAEPPKVGSGGDYIKNLEKAFSDKKNVKEIKRLEKGVDTHRNHPMAFYSSLFKGAGRIMQMAGVPKDDIVLFLTRKGKSKFGKALTDKIMSDVTKYKRKHLKYADLIAPMIFGRLHHKLTKNGMNDMEAKQQSQEAANLFVKHGRGELNKPVNDLNKHGYLFKTLKIKMKKVLDKHGDKINEALPATVSSLLSSLASQKKIGEGEEDKNNYAYVPVGSGDIDGGMSEETKEKIYKVLKVIAGVALPAGVLGSSLLGTMYNKYRQTHGLSTIDPSMPEWVTKGMNVITREGYIKKEGSGDIDGGMSEETKQKIKKVLKVIAGVALPVALLGTSLLGTMYNKYRQTHGLSTIDPSMPEWVTKGMNVITREGYIKKEGSGEEYIGGLSPEGRKKLIKALKIMAAVGIPLALLGTSTIAGLYQGYRNKYPTTKPTHETELVTFLNK